MINRSSEPNKGKRHPFNGIPEPKEGKRLPIDRMLDSEFRQTDSDDRFLESSKRRPGRVHGIHDRGDHRGVRNTGEGRIGGAVRRSISFLDDGLEGYTYLE
jgi:hypothetical protein